MSKPIIHICGASGSGKSFLGKRLTELYGNKIIVKDIDYVLEEFIKDFYRDNEWEVIDNVAYQEFINKYVDKMKKTNKPIIFVGLNNMPWWHPDLYYDFQANYNFYIDINSEKLVKQKCIRYLTEELKEDITNDEMAMNDLVMNNEQFLKLVCEGIKRECDINEITKESNKWKKDYESQGYTVLSADEIYERVVVILNNSVALGKKKKKKTKKNKNIKKRKTSTKRFHF